MQAQPPDKKAQSNMRPKSQRSRYRYGDHSLFFKGEASCPAIGPVAVRYINFRKADAAILDQRLPRDRTEQPARRRDRYLSTLSPTERDELSRQAGDLALQESRQRRLSRALQSPGGVKSPYFFMPIQLKSTPTGCRRGPGKLATDLDSIQISSHIPKKRSKKEPRAK